ncbi:hypothetical protein Y032_0023g762 [Ancylostoma ceylanicum]|uniref:Receptor L-domain domain-containing protein n=1 Tax=Ancylostoma ceylanicum TaxID=53326 RepID=A0A016UYK4_9BILA|nr:hypothetical protein Y032_0023g762 [Ancylostoma ceylanicum]
MHLRSLPNRFYASIDQLLMIICFHTALLASIIQNSSANSPMIDFGNGQPNKERGCNFQAYVINSMTVSTFPVEPTLCWSVTGSVRLDETTDVSHEKLTALFKYLNVLTGKLEIINTQFRNLSFFRPLFSVTGATGEASEVLLIANNSKLETMAGGALLYPVIDRIRIEDNPMLDVNCSHVLENYATLRTIRRNRVNCGCELDGSLTTTNIDTIPDNCDYIFGKLEISGENSPNAEVLTRKFGKATNITGELAILNTNLTSLEFLSNLVNITSKYNVYAEEFIEQFVRIENNVMLERLGWDKLEVVYMSTVSISANPKLCYTVAELDALLYSEYVNVIEGKLCAGDEHSGNSTHICRLANNATLSNLPASCSSITGQLTLDHTMDASDLWKLYNVTSIYGSLSVVNTSMIGLSPLWNLRRLCNPSLNRSALVIESNPRLNSVFLHKLNHTLSNLPIRIADNPELSMSDEECERFNRTSPTDIGGNKQNCQGSNTSRNFVIDCEHNEACNSIIRKILVCASTSNSPEICIPLACAHAYNKCCARKNMEGILKAWSNVIAWKFAAKSGLLCIIIRRQAVGHHRMTSNFTPYIDEDDEN